jgi:hypothetical protein
MTETGEHRTAPTSRWWLLALAALLLLVPCSPRAGELAEDAQECLDCHEEEGMEKELGSGEVLDLYVDREAFAASVHAEEGCAGCHQAIDLDEHPEERSIASRQQYRAALSGLCRECHDEMYDQLEGSIHATLRRDGSHQAPICTDCHGFHTVSYATELATIAGEPCGRCHGEIFGAYEQSMHGVARANGGHITAPICADCHRSHTVEAASWERRLKAACLSCHEGTEETHRQWLPNTGLHLEAVACPSCHAPEAERQVDLVLNDSTTGSPLQAEDFRSLMRVRGIAGRDFSTEGLSALEIWELLREANRGDGRQVTLTGRLEVRTGVEAHRMKPKAEAVRECTSCHSRGAEGFNRVTLSMSRPDGRLEHMGADDDALQSIASMGALRGFYVLGSTRIGLLDFLLIAAVLGGMSVPALHMSARILMRQRQGEKQ